MSESTPGDPFTVQEAPNGSSRQLSDSMAFHTRQIPFQDPQTSDKASLTPVDQSLAHGEKIKNLVKCIQDLRHQGVDSSIDLPNICVVGDQSAGKSSLVQSLSGIKIPRSDGTCTRCPLEVNLTSINNRKGWYCRVFIINKFTLDSGSRRNPQKISRAKPMGPWTLATRPQKIPFAETGEKEEVHDLIRFAQQAILNPSLDPAQFQHERAPDTMEVKFSPNNVCLDISGPGYCDLSFIDLPGVIAATELKSEEYLVDVVKNLMIEHIQSQSCIIILTLSMTEDIENSNAFRLIRKNNAELRTLAVLTKPDCLSDGDRLNRWKDILLGNNQFGFGYGFHTVMMDTDKTLSSKDVIDREERYFAGENWQLIQSLKPEKLGVPLLSESLQDLLSDKVSGQLPQITEKINAKALAIDQSLALLPARPSRFQYPVILAQLVTTFGIHLKSLFGGHVRDAAANRIKVKITFIAEAFRGAILHSRPAVTECSAAERKRYARLPAGSGEADPPEKATPPVDNRANDDSVEIFAGSKALGVTFSLEEIGKFNQQYNSTNIPNQIAPQAIEMMNELSVEHWESPVREFMKHVEDLVKQEVVHLAAEIFHDYQNTQMYHECTNLITNFLDEACRDQLAEGIKAYRMEHSHPLTLDKERLAKGKQEALERLKIVREKFRLKLAEATARGADGAAKGKAKSAKKEELSLEPDPFETHIEIMAVWLPPGIQHFRFITDH